MDVISLSGYTEDEKLGIAKRYLVPKQIEAHGLDDRAASTISDKALRLVIREYTREAGVRGLERRIADLCRKAARKVARGPRRRRSASTSGACARGSGRAASRARCGGAPPTPASRPGSRTRPPAATCSSSRRTAYPGKGRLTITGQLGEVMQESAQAALSWVRSHTDAARRCRTTGSPSTTCTSTCPPAPCRRTGPSAGVTMATAIASLVRGDARSSDDVGMTGEITLTGQVLPIGGVREKVLAAQRAGLKRVILPRENEPDLEDLPAETKRRARVHPRRLDRAGARGRVRRERARRDAACDRQR